MPAPRSSYYFRRLDSGIRRASASRCAVENLRSPRPASMLGILVDARKPASAANSACVMPWASRSLRRAAPKRTEGARSASRVPFLGIARFFACVLAVRAIAGFKRGGINSSRAVSGTTYIESAWNCHNFPAQCPWGIDRLFQSPTRSRVQVKRLQVRQHADKQPDHRGRDSNRGGNHAPQGGHGWFARQVQADVGQQRLDPLRPPVSGISTLLELVETVGGKVAQVGVSTKSSRRSMRSKRMSRRSSRRFTPARASSVFVIRIFRSDRSSTIRSCFTSLRCCASKTRSTSRCSRSRLGSGIESIPNELAKWNLHGPSQSPGRVEPGTCTAGLNHRNPRNAYLGDASKLSLRQTQRKTRLPDPLPEDSRGWWFGNRFRRPAPSQLAGHT
jgi:hypothetical protein